MTTVTISPKFQVVIPKDVRESMKLKKGMKLSVIAYDNQIHLIPVPSIQDLRGMLKGIDSTIIREPDRI